jgi:hypothetical protein
VSGLFASPLAHSASSFFAASVSANRNASTARSAATTVGDFTPANRVFNSAAPSSECAAISRTAANAFTASSPVNSAHAACHPPASGLAGLLNSPFTSYSSTGPSADSLASG